MPHKRPIPHFKKVVQVPWIANLVIDPMGFLRADGLVVGRQFIGQDGTVLLEMRDRRRDKYTALERRYVYVSLADLVEVMNE